MSNDDKLTITLFDRPPVTVSKATWPVLADSGLDHDGMVECQANRRARLLVRAHDDGRTIVYGYCTSQFPGEGDVRGGEMIDGGWVDSDPEAMALVQAIKRVAERVGLPSGMADRCIADLPADTLD